VLVNGEVLNSGGKFGACHGEKLIHSGEEAA
jgi:hypothetical protein